MVKNNTAMHWKKLFCNVFFSMGEGMSYFTKYPEGKCRGGNCAGGGGGRRGLNNLACY